MRWDGRRESDNVDEVGSSGGGGGGGMMFRGGIGTTIVIGLALWAFGMKPMDIVNMLLGGGGSQSSQVSAPVDPKTKEFVKHVLASTEDVWEAEFKSMGKTYERPRLELFTNSVNSGCGGASAQMGPFYCPADHRVYLDVSFFNELEQRFGAPGDFAQAYVIAHEVGHHVQNLLGISKQLDDARGHVSEKQYNDLSVRLELQADFLAGMWAKKGQGNGGYQIEVGDLEEGLKAANAIGDDTLQKESQGRVMPDSFTHGTSAQRVKWFRKGYDTADLSQGDTFHTRDL